MLAVANVGLGIPEVVQLFAASLDVSERTRDTRMKCAGYYLEWLESEGRTGVRADVIAYKAHLAASHAPGTVSVYLGAVRSLHRFLSEQWGIPDPTAGIKGGRKSAGFKKDALTVDQCRMILEHASHDRTLSGIRDYAIINLMMRTGLRTIEVVRADVGDIRNIGTDTVLFIQGKGHSDKDAFVILDNDALMPIQNYLAARGRVPSDAPLFASESNNNLNGRMVTRTVSQICKSSMLSVGIVSDRLTAHSFRHTAITLSLLGGASLQDARAMARHADINTTLIYAHNLERMGDNAGERCISRVLGTVA